MKYTVTFKKRASGLSGYVLVSRILALILSAGIVAIVLLLTLTDKSKIGQALDRLFLSRFITLRGIKMMLQDAIPLLIVTLGIAVAFRMKLWNIGGNGQAVAGAMFAAAIPIYFPELSAAAYIPLMMLAAIIGGALWASVCAFSKAYGNVNETIISLMMNYIAICLGDFLINGIWKDPQSGFNKAPTLPGNAVLPTMGDTGITYAALIAVFLLFVYYILMKKSKWGYEVRVAGENENAARYAGMPVKRNIVLAFLVSGAFAGLAGYVVLAGRGNAASFTTSVNDIGFTAVMVAWLSRLHPTGILFMSLFIAGVKNGCNALQSFGVDGAFADFIQGLILFMVLVCDVLTRYEIKIVKKQPPKQLTESMHKFEAQEETENV